jgi:hypothetical protein
MRVAAAFGLAVLVMLAVVITGDQMVGIKPEMPPMSDANRMGHLQIVIAALGIVVCLNALFIWLALRYPPADEFLDTEHGDG